MAPATKHDKSAAETSSTIPNSPMAGYAKRQSRFAAFMDSDDHDHDDNGGGVMLRDFEDDSHTSGYASTPMGTNSSSSGSARDTDSQKKSTTSSFGRPTASARRHTTMAPIGTGRYGDRSGNADGGAALNPAVSPWTNTQTIANEAREKDESVDKVGNLAGFQNKTGMTSNYYSQTSPTQTAQFGYTQGMDSAVSVNIPSGYGNTTQYSQSATATGYSWGTASHAYNSAGLIYNTPQTGGYGGTQGTALSSNFPLVNPDTTPSHMPKKSANNGLATPQSTSMYNHYNQTEPRNFAPRTGDMPTYIPPPAFNLGRQGTAKKHEYSQSMSQDADPFMSPPHKGTNIPSMSQALVLQSVPEHNQLALTHQPSIYGRAPAEIRAIRSAQLNKLTDNAIGLPSIDFALDDENFPFMESALQAAPVGHGVVKLRNIPFGTKRAEIIAFLGRNSKILNDNQEPVHIIMERVSSKTQDCYVEFMTTQDAVRAVDRHRDNQQKGRPSRLGERPIEVLLSSQGALMQDLFPLAAGVWWDNGKPVIQAPIDGQPWKTFKGFVTEEEMTMLVKHVEIPQRSPYSKECPQRPYECMISTLKKLPWYMADRITLRQRHAIYDATVKLIGLLKLALQRDNRAHETVINPQLLKRLVTAAMLCPGFSVVQKDNIAVLADMEPERARMFNQPRFAEEWVHLHGICPKPGIPIDVLEWYIAVVREETARYVQNKHIVERNEIQRMAGYTSGYFGFIWYELGLPTGKELDNLTLHEVARRELAAIDRVLRRALPGASSSHEVELN